MNTGDILKGGDAMKRHLFPCVLFCALLLTGCTANASAHRFVSPKILAADGSAASLPVGYVYPVSAADVPPETAAAICKAANAELTEDTLNSAWFGENVFGVGLASVVYFGKYAADLSEAEWALLTQIAAAPEQYAGLLAGEAPADPLLHARASEVSRIAGSAYFDAMTETIVCDIMAAQKCSRAEAFRLLYSKGVTVETPFSPEMQRAVNKVYSDAASFGSGSHACPQSACAVTDDQGNLLALAGGNQGNQIYNRAFRILHPAGTAITPMSVYAPAFRAGVIGFSSCPDGKMTVACALRSAESSVSARLCETLSPETCLRFLREKLHFSTLTDADASVSAMALGQLARGISLPELTAAYQIFGNGGIYHALRFYSSVTDAHGKVLAECHPAPVQALASADAWIMNRLLCVGTDHAAYLTDGSEVCGMTGTAEHSGCVFVGLTPEYCAAVWMGSDLAETAVDMAGCQSPAAVWKQIMENAVRIQQTFPSSGNVIAADYCTQSGLLADAGCPETETGYYRIDSLPETCGMHSE